MSTLTVKVSGLSGSFELEVPEGATVADVREAGEINGDLNIRTDGALVTDEDDTLVRDEQILVTTPPNAKHGIAVR